MASFSRFVKGKATSKGRTRFSRQGFSLIELLLVLGVIAVLLVAVFVVYPNVRTNYQVKAQVDKTITLIARLQDFQMYSSQTFGYDTQALVEMGFLEQEDLSPDWGGRFEVHPANIHGSTGCAEGTCNRFALRFLDVPQRVCLPLVSALVTYSDRAIVAPAGTNINVKDVRRTNTPYDPGLAASACTQESTVQLIQFNP